MYSVSVHWKLMSYTESPQVTLPGCSCGRNPSLQPSGIKLIIWCPVQVLSGHACYTEPLQASTTSPDHCTASSDQGKCNERDGSRRSPVHEENCHWLTIYHQTSVIICAAREPSP